MSRFEAECTSLVHLPLEAIGLRVVEGVGTIYRWPLDPDPRADLGEVVLPDWLAKACSSHNYRRDLAFNMRVNSQKPKYPWIGRACSAFIAQFPGERGQELVMDVMITDPDYNDKDDPRTHGYLRKAVDYSKSTLPIDLDCNGGLGVISGHLAPLVISTPDISQIFLVDKLRGSKALQKSHIHIQFLMHVLWANRIMPITANGYAVLPYLAVA